ncbi:MAG: oxygenase MpaB family protein, partial [Solimonas sp.]
DDSSRQLGRALKDEPLQRRYANLAWLRGHWNRAKHLSIARTFIGARGMRALGLPTLVLPWYPLLTAPPRLAWHLLLRALPGGRQWLIRRGLTAQRDYLKVLFGRAEPAIRDAHATGSVSADRAA